MTNYAQARRQADRVEDAWRLHVECSQTPEYAAVRAWPCFLGIIDGQPEFGVRSNLVNGLPPRRKGCECRLPR